LEVVGVDLTFFASGKNGDDSTKRSGLLEEWEKIDDEACAAVISTR